MAESAVQEVDGSWTETAPETPARETSMKTGMALQGPKGCNATIPAPDFRLDREHIGAVANAVPVDSELVQDSQQQV